MKKSTQDRALNVATWLMLLAALAIVTAPMLLSPGSKAEQIEITLTLGGKPHNPQVITDFRPYLRGDTMLIRVVKLDTDSSPDHWRLLLCDQDNHPVRAWNGVGSDTVTWDGMDFTSIPKDYLGRYTFRLFPNPGGEITDMDLKAAPLVIYQGEAFAVYPRETMIITEIDPRRTRWRLLYPCDREPRRNPCSLTLKPTPKDGLSLDQLKTELGSGTVRSSRTGGPVWSGIAAFNTTYFSPPDGVLVSEIYGDIVDQGKWVFDSAPWRMGEEVFNKLQHRALLGLKKDGTPDVRTLLYERIPGQRTYNPGNYQLAVTGLGIADVAGIIGPGDRPVDEERPPFLYYTNDPNNYYAGTTQGPRVVVGTTTKQRVLFAYGTEGADVMVRRLQQLEGSRRCIATAFFDAGASTLAWTRCSGNTTLCFGGAPFQDVPGFTDIGMQDLGSVPAVSEGRRLIPVYLVINSL